MRADADVGRARQSLVDIERIGDEQIYVIPEPDTHGSAGAERSVTQSSERPPTSGPVTVWTTDLANSLWVLSTRSVKSNALSINLSI